MHLSADNETLLFQADSDTLLLRGLLYLLYDTLHGVSLKEISQENLSIFWQLGLNDLFTDERKQGLRQIVEEIQSFACRHS